MYSVDPERIYVNMSASAGTTTTVLSPLPTATYNESRFAPIVQDLSKYKVAVVRCFLNGCRNFPVFIPAIAPNQTDPLKTAYEVTLSLQAYSAGNLHAWPANGLTFALDVQVLTSGYIVTPWVRVPVTTSGTVVTAAAWATLINTALTAAGGAIALITATVNTNGTLHFATSGVNDTFQLCVGLLPGTIPPTADTAAINAFGFAIQTATSAPIASATAPAPAWDAPNIPFVIPSTLIGTLSQTTSLQWVSQTGVQPPLSLALDAAANGGQTTSMAYWCMDYDWFAGIFNTALQTCATQLLSRAAAAGYTPGFLTPYVVYNSAAKTWSMFTDATSVRTLSAPFTGQVFPYYTFQMQITLNGMLEDLFQFPASFDPVTGLATLNFTQCVVAPSASYAELLTPYNPGANLWSPVDSLVFASQLIPVRSEIVSAPTVYGTTGLGQYQTGVTSYDSAQILTDVIPAQNDASDWRSFPILYSPTVLRWVDLPCGALALSKIDFALSWRNARSGVISPVYLNPGANFSVKLLLQRLDVV